MARAKARVSRGEHLASMAVLGLLACFGAWLLGVQSAFNPAVVASLNAPPPRAAAASAAQADSPTARLLAELPGLTPVGVVETWDQETLSDKINGKAELYLSSGFKEMASRGFAPAGVAARVEAYVYSMESPKDAFAVLSGQRRPGAAEAGVSKGAYATENALFFTSGPFYVELVADKASPEVQAALLMAASGLMAALPAADEAALDEAALLPERGLKAESMRMTVSDAFGVDGFSNVFTADYALPGGEATAFVSLTGAPDKAAAKAATYHAFLTANGYAVVQAAGAPANATVYQLDASFEVVFTRQAVLAGVHDAQALAPALELAQALAARLAEKSP